MALETLKGMDLGEYIKVNHETNEITFKIQNGPIREAGENGCQVDDVICVAQIIIAGLNKNFPSSLNRECVAYLEMALAALDKRREERIKRDVEGYSKA